jgi:hypothetical protein
MDMELLQTEVSSCAKYYTSPGICHSTVTARALVKIPLDVITTIVEIAKHVAIALELKLRSMYPIYTQLGAAASPAGVAVITLKGPCLGSMKLTKLYLARIKSCFFFFTQRVKTHRFPLKKPPTFYNQKQKRREREN